jgi:hypothetical protein
MGLFNKVSQGAGKLFTKAMGEKWGIQQSK